MSKMIIIRLKYNPILIFFLEILKCVIFVPENLKRFIFCILSLVLSFNNKNKTYIIFKGQKLIRNHAYIIFVRHIDKKI